MTNHSDMTPVGGQASSGGDVHTFVMGTELNTLLTPETVLVVLKGRIRVVANAAMSIQNGGASPSDSLSSDAQASRTLAVLSPGAVLTTSSVSGVSLVAAPQLRVSSDEAVLQTFPLAALATQPDLQQRWERTAQLLLQASVTQPERNTALGRSMSTDTPEDNRFANALSGQRVMVKSLPAQPQAASAGLTAILSATPDAIATTDLDIRACFIQLMSHFNRPLTGASFHVRAHTLAQFAQQLYQHGFVVRQEQVTWSQLLQKDFPYVLALHSTCYWVVGRTGNRLLAAQAENASPTLLAAPQQQSKATTTFDVLSLAHAGGNASAMDQPFGLAWYRNLLMQHPFLSAQMVTASVLVQLFALGLPFFYMVIFDRVFGHQNLNTLDIMAMGIVMVMVLDGLVRTVRAYVLSHQLEALDQSALDTVLQQAFRLPLARVTPEVIRAFGRQFNDVVKANQVIVSTFFIHSLDMLFSGIIILFLCGLHAQLALISLSPLVPIALLSWWQAPQARQRAATSTQEINLCQLKLTESLQQAETIQSLNAGQRLQWQLSTMVKTMLTRHFRTRFDRVSGPQAQSLLINLGTIATLYFGAKAVLSGEISYGVYMAINMMGRSVLGSLQKLLGAMAQLQEVTESLESIKPLMRNPNAEAMALSTSGESPQHGNLYMAQVQGHLQLSNVYFRYPAAATQTAPWVLQGLTLTLSPGEKVALVGSSGSGKTTVLRLLQRLYAPTSGHLSLDGINLADLDPGFLAQHLGVAIQRPALLAGTLRENLLLGNPEASMQALMASVSQLGLDSLLLGMPQGLDAMVLPMGENLSAADRALVALARVLLIQPSVLALDAALTDLDLAVSRRITTTLMQTAPQQTQIFVSDDPWVHQQVDRILVLANGQLVESGTYTELRGQRGFYDHLFPETALSANGFAAVSSSYAGGVR